MNIRRNCLLGALLFLFAGRAHAAPDPTAPAVPAREAAPLRIANPAAVYCGQKGGTLKPVPRIVDGKDYGTYSACLFADNRRCEEWAMFRGACPVGGLKITGYDSEQQIYCAITGGTVDMDSKACGYANGANCDLEVLFSGRCRQQTIPTASGIHYRQYPETALAIAYLKGTMALVESSGGVSRSAPAAHEKGSRLRLTVDVTRLADLPAEGPLGFNRHDAEQERAALEAGSFGPSTMPAVAASGKVLTAGSLKMKTFITLARFEVCSVLFERVARFYHADTMVTMTLAADPGRLMADNPDYFAVDARNCGKPPVWRRSSKHSGSARFYADLVAGKVSRSALNWYHAFQAVVGATVVRESPGR